jgi:putative NADPH-quinone reductase
MRDLKNLSDLKNKKEYKIVAVYGSPRRGGNTDTLMNKFLEGLNECKINNLLKMTVGKIFVSNLKISPCRECCNCSKTGECIINDDMQLLYPKLMDCDFLAIASPIFFTTVSGYLKAFIDRFQRFWALKYELRRKIITREDRKGILISTAGSKSKDIFDCAKKVTRSLFDVLYIRYYGDFLFNKIDKKDDILNSKEAMEAIYNFGREGKFLKKGG